MPAVHLRRRGLGRDRRAHHREPDPPPARRPGSRCRSASRTAPTATSQVAVDAVRAAAVPHAFAGVDVSGTPGDPPHARQPRLPRHPARRQRRAQLRRERRDRGALAKLRAARLPERLVIDASHDNSGKDHDRQPAVGGRRRAARSPRATRAIVGVMLESFLVAGRQELGAGAELAYGQSITDACMDWDTTVGGARASWRGAVRARRRGDLSAIAVLGVGLIGGSIGLAARERARRARWAASDRDPGGSRRALELGAIDEAGGSLGRGAGRRRGVLRLRARWARCPTQVRRRAGRGRARTAWSPTSARPSAPLARPIDDPRFVGGHPIAGAETRGRGARPRRPVPGRRLVPDARPRRTSGLLYERLHRLAGGHRRPARWRSTPATHDRLMAGVQPPPARARQRAGLARRRGRLADQGEALPPRGAELPRRDPRGRRQHARSGPTSTSPTATPIVERDRRLRRARWSEVRGRSLEADAATWPSGTTRARDDRRRAARGRRWRAAPVARAAPHGAEPARYRRRGGARARQGGGEHRRHGAGAGVRHARRAR